MIDKEIILKTLDTAIWKCSQRIMLSKSVKESFNNFHDNYCNNKTKIEHGIITDIEGNILWEGTGNDAHLEIPSYNELEELHKEYGDLYLTHNHPRTVKGGGYEEVVAPVSECLSPKDILSISYNSLSSPYMRNENGKLIPLVKSISCESYNGSRMTFTMGDNFKPTTMNEGIIYSLANKLKDYYLNYESKYYDTFNQVQADYLKSLDEGVRPLDNFKSDDDYVKFLDDETCKIIGVFEKNPEFKDIQKGFRDLNCKLTYTFPRPYHKGV